MVSPDFDPPPPLTQRSDRPFWQFFRPFAAALTRQRAGERQPPGTKRDFR
jgi:hypothetical protein